MYTNEQFYKLAKAYLKKAYFLEPNDIDLSVMSVINRGENETPIQYIDNIAVKYNLTKLR